MRERTWWTTPTTEARVAPASVRPAGAAPGRLGVGDVCSRGSSGLRSGPLPGGPRAAETPEGAEGPRPGVHSLAHGFPTQPMRQELRQRARQRPSRNGEARPQAERGTRAGERERESSILRLVQRLDFGLGCSLRKVESPDYLEHALFATLFSFASLLLCFGWRLSVSCRSEVARVLVAARCRTGCGGASCKRL